MLYRVSVRDTLGALAIACIIALVHLSYAAWILSFTAEPRQRSVIATFCGVFSIHFKLADCSVMIVRRSLAYERRNRVARTVTGFLPNIRTAQVL